ncbi:MAG: hypothetical protein HC918_08540 [Oscillatoriales cyanobacterium SM2_1_8]|nr:hypothetical protein [Oscillatoriales cyanobacterium SM2_1_8]
MRIGGGTAILGQDFTPSEFAVGPLEPGQSQTFFVNILDDDIPEDVETLPISLAVTGEGRITSPSSAIVTITDNDPVPPPVSPPGQLLFFRRCMP